MPVAQFAISNRIKGTVVTAILFFTKNDKARLKQAYIPENKEVSNVIAIRYIIGCVKNSFDSMIPE